MRWIIPIVIYLLIEIYAYQAVRTITRNQIVQIGYFVLSILVISYVIYIFTNYDRNVGPTQYTLRASGLLLVTIVPKLILVLFMFGEDIVRVCVAGYNYLSNTFFEGSAPQYLPDRRKFISQVALGIAAIPFAGLIHGIFRGKYNYKVITHVLHYDDLPEAFDGLRITQISDIHSGSFDEAEKIEYAVDLINEQESDLLLFTGDIVNTMAKEMDDWIDTFKRIKTPKYGKYSVLGNHDYGEYVTWESEEEKEANFEAIKDIHNKIDFNLLLNDSAFLEKDGERIAIVGVENWGHNFKKAGDLTLASKNVTKEDFKILLSHDPSHWEYEVKKHEDHYHLTLSGHTHGFQFGIEIPGFIRWSPVQYVYKQWAGMYNEMGRYLNVNRGFGFHAFPGRVGIWPEITVIELRKGVKPA
ncbi:metallophosphoesterase [Aquimarina sp. 2201CG5-10]|uniref:metallophosphoesterase n=1 Tax=Aquimarina callyspongiae TaxID=3098150 RepID=UPI002AB5905B|nr:metallophosphoesterase [Aquimarina sp. 2201CG5-10]MDY8136738.1 metallophosphoesterase [Aquimarina sp. 2201CG5-10]